MAIGKQYNYKTLSYDLAVGEMITDMRYYNSGVLQNGVVYDNNVIICSSTSQPQIENIVNNSKKLRNLIAYYYHRK